ncbi:MAG TPA: DUF4190 domain-containing protein [Anaerolineales bacterium]|nr:DUF4190 domain-containing protein [Anaerolineales bacterium]
MNEQSNIPMSPQPSTGGNERMFAIGSLVIGIINLCAWFVPICGFPLGLVGVVLGYLGMKDVSQKNLAIAGMVLSGIGILLACINAIAGVFMNTDLFRQLLQGG